MNFGIFNQQWLWADGTMNTATSPMLQRKRQFETHYNMARQRKNSGYLLFIDTNILLDFYRIRKSDISLKYLKEIEDNLDKLILTSQVEMEFRKNRQIVILEALTEI